MKNTQYPRGAVYYVDLGEADGTSIQAGVRPCILVSSDINNFYSPNVNIVSLTTSRTKSSLPVHIFCRQKSQVYIETQFAYANSNVLSPKPH